MRAARAYAAIASGALLAACALFGDLDGLSSGAPPGFDAGDDVTDAPPSPATDAAAPSDGAAGADAADAAAYRAAVLADGPVSYWPLDDDVGSLVARDIVGIHHATVNGAATFGASAVAGGAIAIDDANTFLEVGDFFDFPGTAAFTIEAWALPRLDLEWNNVGVKRGADLKGWTLYFHQDGSVQFEQFWVGGERVGFTDAPRSHPRPAHVVVTFDGSKLAMYLDSVKLLKTFQSDGGPDDLPTSMQWGGGYRGVLDELAIYDHALAPERVSAHFKAAGR